jgi:hypothetical protein
VNERIRELADEIWEKEYWDNPNTDKLLPAQLNRFAELIIEECAAQCWTVSELESKGFVVNECTKRIRKHFGVEQ